MVENAPVLLHLLWGKVFNFSKKYLPLFIILLWSLNVPVHKFSSGFPFLFAKPVEGTKILMKIAQLTKILTIKLSFMSGILFHTQRNINFINVTKKRILRLYQIMTFFAHIWIKHTSKYKGPNHTLIFLIPHVTIQYIAPWEVIVDKGPFKYYIINGMDGWDSSNDYVIT